MEPSPIAWLLEPKNPGVRLRTLTQLCGEPPSHPDVIAAKQAVLSWLPTASDPEWMQAKGLKLIYLPMALGECGLTRTDIEITPAVETLLSYEFGAGCGDMMILRGLVMMGYLDDPRVREKINRMSQMQLADGGWFCLHRLRKMKRIPKSCYKADMHALLLAAELKRRGETPNWVDGMVSYFIKHRIFYKTAEPDQLVTGGRPGWRVIDSFFPPEVMRVGLPQMVEAFAALGFGSHPALAEAWALLESKRDAQGRVKLEGTLSKNYLPKESVGKPSKWATFYTALAYHEAGIGIS